MTEPEVRSIKVQEVHNRNLGTAESLSQDNRSQELKATIQVTENTEQPQPNFKFGRPKFKLGTTELHKCKTEHKIKPLEMQDKLDRTLILVDRSL